MRTRVGLSPARASRSDPRGGPDPWPAPRTGTSGVDAPALADEVLVARAAEGDDDAFAVLVHRHSGALLALAFHMLGSLADAEEALQEAFISAWRRLPEFRRSAAFRTWMYRIVTNRCLNTLRSRTPSVPLDAVPEPAARDAGGQPAAAAEYAAATRALTKALADLRPAQRACWVLRELHGLSYGEIAHVVGASEQTVRGRLFRARRTLVKEMASWR
jgi:RNA polymerase sigma-70 factor (ECF subfamily)